MALFIQVIPSVLGGILIAEIPGYFWHRFFAHGRWASWVPNDFLRRRHFQHHIEDYLPTERFTLKEYIDSCEITFNFAAGILIAGLTYLWWIGYIELWQLITIVSIGIFWGAAVIAPMHNSYHIENWHKKHLPKFMWKTYEWLRDVHEVHHWRGANYMILLPWDMLFESYIGPEQLTEIRNTRSVEGQFPGFNSTASTCGESFLFQTNKSA